jgi:hypothetical protein
MKLRGADAVRIRRVLKFVCDCKSLTQGELLDQIKKMGAESISAGGLAKRKAFSDRFVECLMSVVGGLRPHEQAFLEFELNPDLLSGVSHTDLVLGGPALKSMRDWLNVKPSLNRLTTHCVNDDGHYLLLRMKGPSQISLSEMRIEFKSAIGLLPTFTTTRIGAEGVEKVVRGTIFESGLTVYAIGQIVDDPGLRFSRLNYFNRSGRTDLYGLRLGHSNETQRPFAHIVYAYQLKRKRERLSELLTATDIRDPLFSDIEGFETILRLIQANQMLEGGLQPHSLNT